jgi:hypothetical protein
MQDRTKARWSEAQAQKALGAWRRSGLPLATHARQAGVPVWRLRWWARRLGEAELRAAPRAPSVPELIPVVVRASRMEPRSLPGGASRRDRTAGAGVQLWVGDELRIELASGVGPREVAELVMELRRVIR